MAKNNTVEKRNSILGMSFFAPALVLMAIFLFIPMILTLVFSFTDYFALNPSLTSFVGLENYVSLFRDRLFVQAFGNTILFVIIIVPLQMGLAFGLTLFIDKISYCKTYFKCVIMIGVSLLFLFPVIWMVANSFKGDAQIIHDMNTFGAFIPPNLDGNFFSNYVTIIQNSDLMKYMCNTIFYAAILIVLSVLVNGLAGYALAKIKFPFREGWVLVITLLMIVPAETIITINYMMIAKAGLLNNIIGYILPMIVNPFNIFLFRQVFIQLPDELREAAEMDHCGNLKYFLQIVLPMSKSVVATVRVFTFLNVWNDFIWPSLIFTSNDLLTVQIGLNSITANDNTTAGQVLATIALITIPVIIIYSLFSKQIVEGVTISGTKEG